MNLRFLETFVWLARLKNFRLTAEKLHTTQAAVSSRIATLEQEFGVRLFDRSAREVALTLDGSKALAYAERMVRLMHEMREDMADRSLYAGVVRIGVIESIIHSWFPDLVARIHRAYPRLEIELTSDTTIHLVEQFRKGNLDLVLQTDGIPDPQVQNLPLCDFPMRWVGSPSLGLQGDELSLAEIAAFPILSFSRNSGPHKFVERLFEDTLGRPVRVNCMTSVAAMIRLVADGFGLALIPPAIIQRELRDGEMQLLRVDAAMPDLTLVGSYRSGPETPLFQQVAAMAQNAAHDFASGLGNEIARIPVGQMADEAWRSARDGASARAPG